MKISNNYMMLADLLGSGLSFEELDFDIKWKECKVVDVEVDGISGRDAPDFCDAYICGATWQLPNGDYIEFSEDDLNVVNEYYSDFVYECVIDYIY